MALIARELFEDTWAEIELANATLGDQWAERVLLGGGAGDLEDTWREIAGPPLARAALLDTWAERRALATLTDGWRELPDLVTPFSEDVQRPVGRVEEE